MSVASAIIPAPSFFLSTAVIAPTASPATNVPVLTTVLPAGKWLVFGSVLLAGNSSALVVAEVQTTGSAIDGFTFGPSGGPVNVRLPVATLYASNGITPFVISVSVTTVSGNWSSNFGSPIEFCQII